MTQIDSLTRYLHIELPVRNGNFNGGQIEAYYGLGFGLSATVLGVNLVTARPFTPERNGALHDLVYKIDPDTLEGDGVPYVFTRPQEDLLAHPFETMGQPDMHALRNHRAIDYFLESEFGGVRVVYTPPTEPVS